MLAQFSTPGVLLLQPYLVRYDQRLMAANVSTLKLDIAVKLITV